MLSGSHSIPKQGTNAAFNLAWQQGADGIEGDFHLTKDGEIVCIHDTNTERAAHKEIRNSAMTLGL